MVNEIFALVIGLALLTWGAEWLVCGGSKLARAIGVSPLAIGLTIVAIGTSLPELATSVIGIEIASAHGAAATMKTVARVIHSAQAPLKTSGGRTAMRMPMTEIDDIAST